MTNMDIFNIIAGTASVVSLLIAIATIAFAQSTYKNVNKILLSVHNQTSNLDQKIEGGSGNQQAGGSINGNISKY